MSDTNTISSGSPFRQNLSVIFRLMKKNPIYILGAAFIAAYLIFSVLATLYPPITGYDVFALNLDRAFKPPSLQYPFGTDDLGRNILSKVLAGAPIDSGVSLFIVGSSLGIGLLSGAIAGYFGGVVDQIIMRVTDIFLAFPGLVLALAIASALGSGTINAIIALLVVWWPVYTRLARGETLAVNSHPYILAAKASGLSRTRIVISHVIPNVLPPLIAYATVDLGSVIIFFSVLGFLGLGAQPPLVDIGRIVYDGRNFIQTAPWYSLLPGAVLFLIVISFALVGDLIQDYLDPSTRK